MTAAGNDGPGLQNIGSPGRNFGFGYSWCHLQQSYIKFGCNLEVDENSLYCNPNGGFHQTRGANYGKIVFGGYGKFEESS